jgi:hypothetical protein
MAEVKNGEFEFTPAPLIEQLDSSAIDSGN